MPRFVDSWTSSMHSLHLFAGRAAGLDSNVAVTPVDYCICWEALSEKHFSIIFLFFLPCQVVFFNISCILLCYACHGCHGSSHAQKGKPSQFQV